MTFPLSADLSCVRVALHCSPCAWRFRQGCDNNLDLRSVANRTQRIVIYAVSPSTILFFDLPKFHLQFGTQSRRVPPRFL